MKRRILTVVIVVVLIIITAFVSYRAGYYHVINNQYLSTEDKDGYCIVVDNNLYKYTYQIKD